MLFAEKKPSKPLSFALQAKKKPSNIVKKTKAVEVFKEDHEGSNSESEEIIELDGYRPNKVTSGKTALEKAKLAMQQAKELIAEAQQKQKEMQAITGSTGWLSSVLFCDLMI